MPFSLVEQQRKRSFDGQVGVGAFAFKVAISSSPLGCEETLPFPPFLGYRLVGSLSFVAEQIVESRALLAQRLIRIDAFLGEAGSNGPEVLRHIGQLSRHEWRGLVTLWHLRRAR